MIQYSGDGDPVGQGEEGSLPDRLHQDHGHGLPERGQLTHITHLQSTEHCTLYITSISTVCNMLLLYYFSAILLSNK